MCFCNGSALVKAIGGLSKSPARLINDQLGSDVDSPQAPLVCLIGNQHRKMRVQTARGQDVGLWQLWRARPSLRDAANPLRRQSSGRNTGEFNLYCTEGKEGLLLSFLLVLRGASPAWVTWPMPCMYR